MESVADSAEDVAELTIWVKAVRYSRTSLLGLRLLVAKHQLGWQAKQHLLGDGDDDGDFAADCLRLLEKTDCQSLVVNLAAAHLFVDRQEAIG